MCRVGSCIWIAPRCFAAREAHHLLLVEGATRSVGRENIATMIRQTVLIQKIADRLRRDEAIAMARQSDAPINIRLVDRRTLVRASLAAALECLAGVQVRAQVATADEAQAMLEQAKPHVIVLALTDQHALATLARLLGTQYGHAVIVLADSTNPELSA